MGTNLLNSNLKRNLLAVVGLNAFDAIATITWITQGLATEANPLMAQLIEYSPIYFLLIKIGIGTVGCYYLWRCRTFSLAVYASKFLLIAYTLLAGYHMIGFYKLIEKTFS